jgi:hypothetical protein
MREFVNDQMDPSDSTDVAEFFRNVWRHRNFVFLGASLLTSLVMLVAWLTASFTSEGLFQLVVPSLRAVDTQQGILIGSPSFSDYKRVVSAVGERQRMESYIRSKKLTEDKGLSNLPDLVSSRDTLVKILEPQLNISRADARELVDIGAAVKETATQMIGVRVSPSASDPIVAQERARMLAEYVRDTAFHIGIIDYGRSKETELAQSLLNFDEQLIARRFELKQLFDKNSAFRQIGIRNPDAARLGSGQVVGLNDTTVRFLPLPTQLVALESQIFEVNQVIERASRAREQAEVSLGYYRLLRSTADKAPSGEAVVTGMSDLLAKALSTRSVEDEKFKQVKIALELEINRIENAFFTRSRFISGPSLPSKRGWKPILILAISMLGSLVMLCIVVLTREWFRNHKTTIIS